MQRTVHPDMLATNPGEGVPEGFSSLLNKAITVIKSPTERAMHLLYLLDGCSISESKLTNDTSLLMDMMEINEEVDECGCDKACLEHQGEANQKRLEECDIKLRGLFSSRQYSEARQVCERMHYLERIKNTVIEKLNSL
jgi:Fe-S protein assembly co-chaperone HscB